MYRIVITKEEEKELCRVWKRICTLPLKEAQQLFQEMLERIRAIERTKTLVITKDNKGVSTMWRYIYIPAGETNNVLQKLCIESGLSKEKISFYSRAKWRKESPKAYGNAIVPQVAIQIMKAIKEAA